MSVDWGNGAVGATGGAIAAFVAWMLGRSDSAQQRREAETRRIAREVLIEQAIDKRVTLIEVALPRIEIKIDDTAEVVLSTRKTLEDLVLSGRLQIKRDAQ